MLMFGLNLSHPKRLYLDLVLYNLLELVFPFLASAQALYILVLVKTCWIAHFPRTFQQEF